MCLYVPQHKLDTGNDTTKRGISFEEKFINEAVYIPTNNDILSLNQKQLENSN